MIAFVDTSAFFATLDRDDARHKDAAAAWRQMLEKGVGIVTTNYVLLETSALVQRRLGLRALELFSSEILAVADVEWIDERRHRAAVEMTLAAGRKELSLVDCSSFLVMREAGIRTVFCFDRHFEQQGFEVLPDP